MSFLTGFEHFIHADEPLAPHTWLRLGGPAQYFAEPTTHEELAALVKRCRDEAVPIRMLGGGSNILVREEGVKGVVVRLSAPAFTEIRTTKEGLTAGGGVKLGHVISTAVREGLAGLETLVGIPGTVGGALHNNSGTRGGDIGQFTVAATVLTRSGDLLKRQPKDLHFAYRHSSLDELAILDAQFQLDRDDPAEITRRMQTLWIVKRAKQPLGNYNAGRIFKNPRGGSAAELIEQAGCKGLRSGGAEVSNQHANFILANPGAKSDDILKLIDTVRKQVAERLGTQLEQEIEVW